MHKRKNPVDERSLILDALKQEPITPQVDFNFPEPDAIDKWIKRKAKLESYKHKSCQEWNNADILRYLDSMFKDFGVSRAKRNFRQDSDQLNRVFDRLSSHIEGLDNLIFKEYLEWWCSIWASRYTGLELYLTALMQDYQIKLFAKRFKEEPSEEPIIQEEQALPNVTDDSIFGLGGLELLVLKRGIVVSLCYLKKIGDHDPAHKIRKTLSAYSKASLINLVNTTISHSPYAMLDKVDFLLLVQPMLDQYGIVDFKHISYSDYFREI